jgi:hypothetical protein
LTRLWTWTSPTYPEFSIEKKASTPISRF